MREDSIVFTSARIGQLEIKNRLVRSATYENAATSKGEVSDFLVDLYRTLAKGGVGLIITGTAGVYSKALAPHLVVRADDDSFIPSLEKIPRAVREVAPDCKVMLQLHHPGRQVINRENAAKLVPVLPPALVAYIQKHPEVILPPKEAPHVVEPTAPSAVYDATFDRTPRALTPDEIDEIIEAFAEGARRAQEASFDGVQFHAAHGYLLSSFLSPRTGIKAQDQEAYFLPGARALKDKTNATVILVGGLRSFSKIEEVLTSKVVDFVSMSRPLIRQPDLPILWCSGEGPDKAECISCNACLPIGTARLACRAKRQ